MTRPTQAPRSSCRQAGPPAADVGSWVEICTTVPTSAAGGPAFGRMTGWLSMDLSERISTTDPTSAAGGTAYGSMTGDWTKPLLDPGEITPDRALSGENYA